jgi:hypothetical protein
MPRAPLGRERLPHCSRDGEMQSATFGRSARYRLHYGEKITIESAGATITLPESTQPYMAPDEKSFAYVEGEAAVVRALPGGAVIAEVRLGK